MIPSPPALTAPATTPAGWREGATPGRLFKRVTLTGFMGAGKTTIGRLLARKLGWEFVDTDGLVVSLSGRTIPELFAAGEPEFRTWERQAIATLHQRAP